MLFYGPISEYPLCMIRVQQHFMLCRCVFRLHMLDQSLVVNWFALDRKWFRWICPKFFNGIKPSSLSGKSRVDLDWFICAELLVGGAELEESGGKCAWDCGFLMSAPARISLDFENVFAIWADFYFRFLFFQQCLDVPF